MISDKTSSGGVTPDPAIVMAEPRKATPGKVFRNLNGSTWGGRPKLCSTAAFIMQPAISSGVAGRSEALQESHISILYNR
jgi:hypothetical protein